MARRYGILISGLKCQAWMHQCLEALLDVDGAEPVVVIRPNKNDVNKRSRPTHGSRLFKTWMKFENRVRPRASMVRCEFPQAVESLPQMKCAFEQHDSYAYRLAAADVERLHELDLDFIAAFLGFDILRGDILDVPRFGVWSYHHGDWTKFRGLPAGFWEIHDQDPHTGAVLQRLTDRLDSGVVLRKGDFSTRATSCNANYDNVFFGAAPWMSETCKALCNRDEARFEADPANVSSPIRKAPSNRQTLRVIRILAAEHLRRTFRRRGPALPEAPA